MNEKIGNHRWTICGLVFFATTINYLDRNVISYLKPYIAEAFNWSPEQEVIDYSNIEIAFKLSYAFGMFFAGNFIDKFGTRIGYAIATGLWSLAAITHAFATGTLGFIFARIFLGVTEAGNFPAAIKVVAEWFPQKERALATGIFNSGSNIGAIVVPLSVPFLAENYGWQVAFVITGAIGFIWLLAWLFIYANPSTSKYIKSNELNYIESNSNFNTPTITNGTKSSWKELLLKKETWAFSIGKFLTDPIWWFYLFWLPDFLMKQYNLVAKDIVFPSAMIYLIASFGSVFGGWLPLKLNNKNIEINKARKIAMFIFALLVVPVIFTQNAGKLNMWYAVFLIGLAAAAHQAWSANIFTTVSDMFPKKDTATVTGIGGMFGSLGGVLLTWLVQKNMFVYYTKMNQIETGYFIMFLICGFSYLTAWIIIHLLLKKR